VAQHLQSLLVAALNPEEILGWGLRRHVLKDTALLKRAVFGSWNGTARLAVPRSSSAGPRDSGESRAIAQLTHRDASAMPRNDPPNSNPLVSAPFRWRPGTQPSRGSEGPPERCRGVQLGGFAYAKWPPNEAPVDHAYGENGVSDPAATRPLLTYGLACTRNSSGSV
jgi:hypothetical protein